MSSAKTKDPVMQSTRQMLDELDALLERMMTVPVEEDETPAPPVKPVTVSASLTLLADEPPSYFDLPKARKQSDEALQALEAKLPSLEETTRRWLEQNHTPPQPEPEIKTSLPELPEIDLPPRISRGPAPELPDPNFPAPARGRLAYWIALGFNGLFDVPTYLLGPLGAWLRGPVGRDLLGWSGIFLLMGAIGWGAVKWMGWP